MPRVYLDNAATSWPKPESVYQAVDEYQRELGAAAGRGSYRAADEIQRVVDRCRQRVAKLTNAPSSDEIIFTYNCTDSLNLAIHGFLQSGDHAVTSAADHNSILRPLHASRRQGVDFSIVQVTSDGTIDLEKLASVVSERNTRLIAITHVSNVTGRRQPIEEVVSIAAKHGCYVLLDAAQSIGHEPLDVQQLGVHMLAAPGHKGLLGPLGTGVLYIDKKLHPFVHAVRQGGTGTHSELPEQPSRSPNKFEAGNPNVPGIVGLDAGIAFVAEHELPASTHLFELSDKTLSLLRQHSEVMVHSLPNRYGIVSFNLRGMDPRELATTLDSMCGVQVRAGLHCAPEMHRALGTFSGGGTVRASYGHFSKPDEVDTLLEAVETLIANPMT